MNARRLAQLAALHRPGTPAALLELGLADAHVFSREDLYDVELPELLYCCAHVLKSPAYRRACDEIEAYSNGLGDLADARLDDLRRWQREQARDAERANGHEDLDPHEHGSLMFETALLGDIERTRRDMPAVIARARDRIKGHK
jgi:hypothetical protein